LHLHLPLSFHRLPGLESSNNNKIEEDEFYDEMMSSLLKIVLNPLLNSRENFKCTLKDVGFWEYIKEKDDTSDADSHDDDDHNIQDHDDDIKDETWKNLLKWKLFTRRNRDKIQLSCINKY
jgi:hypothetical protein